VSDPAAQHVAASPELLLNSLFFAGKDYCWPSLPVLFVDHWAYFGCCKACS